MKTLATALFAGIAALAVALFALSVGAVGLMFGASILHGAAPAVPALGFVESLGIIASAALVRVTLGGGK